MYKYSKIQRAKHKAIKYSAMQSYNIKRSNIIFFSPEATAADNISP